MSTPEEFEDPLSNYEPPEYDDPLHQALAEETVAEISGRPFLTITPDTPIERAVRTLADAEIACLLVAEDYELKGVFSLRDMLDKVADRLPELKGRPVSEFMSAEPVYVQESDSASAAISVMAVIGHRHVPVLDVNDKIAGIVSPQRVTRFLLDRFE
ncbi:CBS domain protein [Planctomycetes bacterium Pan216]|uniref:CBS domain protein n=1 Tax=Kolteria novifilia TaxID=2527975 RepID=A0A518B9J9_9BACT|nr:CBS domain protein [Planctomycetes bacterium Pan216]